MHGVERDPLLLLINSGISMSLNLDHLKTLIGKIFIFRVRFVSLLRIEIRTAQI